MRVFAKNMIKIALIAIVAGIILLGIGFNEYNPFTRINNYFDFDVLESFGNSFTNDQRDSSYKGEVREQKIQTVYNENFQSEAYEDVDSIQIQITIGSVIIQEGDTFHVEAKHINEEEFTSEYANGSWKITYTENGYNYNSNNISDFDEAFEAVWNSDNKAPQFIITAPKEFLVDDFKLDLGFGKFIADKIQAHNLEVRIDAGIFNAEKINAEYADLTVETGEIDVDELEASEQSYYRVNAGKIEINQMDAKDITAECGIGELRITGEIIGNNTIKNDIGDVNISVDGKEEDYNYQVDCEIGTVIINNNRYSGVSSQTKNNTGAENSFNVECGIGKVSLKIN